MKDKVPTTDVGCWRDVDLEPPPHNVKLNLLTKYGIAQYGTYQEGFHIGWNYCLKIPEPLKEKLRSRYET